MASKAPVAGEAVLEVPSDAAIERVAAFTREPFGTGEIAVAPGTPRRRAFDAALIELEEGARVPSVGWRQTWSLLLGLERLLSETEPKLADGTILSAHQVDALSGTLTALLTERGNGNGNGIGNGNGSAASSNGRVATEIAQLASAGIPGDDDEDDEPEEPQDWDEEESEEGDAQAPPDVTEDPNAGKRFWFEHATGAGKTVAALGFVEASRTGGVLILTHRRNLVDQFLGELRDRGYSGRIAPPMLRGEDRADGPVTVETYQWYVRNAGNVSDSYAIVICDEAHTALGEKTSTAIRKWDAPVFVGMTATGALIARHVTDLFPTQTSRFDLVQAARRGVISPLRCVRIPPGPGVRTIAKVPLRRGEVDTEFDQELLAELLDQQPFNLAIADLYKTRFDGLPGVVYAAGVRHAYNVAEAFRDVGLKAQAVSGETPKRELAQILARYEKGEIDVLVNAQLLAEGWNSPRATVCMHLAPTASKRIYQQRDGRVTRRQPGKEAGIVVDFVHPATKHDDPVVTLHSLLDRDVYRGGAIVIGPVRRGRGRRLRVERRVLPVTADENRRIEVFERELWRIAVEHLDYGEQVQWAALAGARVTAAGWRRARAMLHFDQGGELKRTFLITAVDRNKNSQLRLRALQETAASRDGETFDRALDYLESWPRDDKREGVKAVLQSLAERKIGRRDQANNWIWRCANMTREVHEEYAVLRWPETKRLLGLLVNSSGAAHARNARRLVHAAREQDRRLSAALLAAAIPHTAEAGEVINGARMRMSRKPAALARELLRNFPKGKGRRSSSRRRRGGGTGAESVATPVSPLLAAAAAVESAARGEDLIALPPGQPVGDVSSDRADAAVAEDGTGRAQPRRRRVIVDEDLAAAEARQAAGDSDGADGAASDSDQGGATAKPARRIPRRRAAVGAKAQASEGSVEADADVGVKPKRAVRRRGVSGSESEEPVAAEVEGSERAAALPEAAETAKPKRVSRAKVVAGESSDAVMPKRTARARAVAGEAAGAVEPKRTARSNTAGDEAAGSVKPKRTRGKAISAETAGSAVEKPKRARRAKAATDAAPEVAEVARTRTKAAADDPVEPAKPKRKRPTRAQAAGDAVQTAAAERSARSKSTPAAEIAPANPKRTTRAKMTDEPATEKPKRATRTKAVATTDVDQAAAQKPKRAPRRRAASADADIDVTVPEKPKRKPR